MRMQISVRYKLFFAILLATGLAVISSAMIMKWSLDRGFLRFVNATEQSSLSRLAVNLEDAYRSEQNWDFLRHDLSRWRTLIARSLPEIAPPPNGHFLREGALPDKKMSQHLPHQFDQRLFLLDTDRKAIINDTPVPAGNTPTPITCQGKVVGYLGLLPRTGISEMPHKRFLKEQKQGLILQAAVIVALAALLSLLMARRLVRPLNELTQATHQLAAGRFAARVPVGSHDELGQLAMDFNSLAVSLEQSEQSRRQWVADISHELRTPIAILQGEIEALQDGIRRPNEETIKSLHHEVLRLGRLVDDLYQLSLSDVGALTYRKTDLDLVELLMETMAVYKPQYVAKDIRIETDISGKDEATVFGDQERLCQLFSNLLDNSLKYTDAGGSVRIALQQHENSVTVDFADSAPGVPRSELGRLFDRLYRVESSRNRSTGGAGLGLAICRNIVEAHGGEITAQPSTMGGLLIRIELPKVWS